MVVCKCRKATKLYCFVHKAPVCGECISFPEHNLCVVKTYSDWVIDGDFDWPPKCSSCQQILQETDDVTRLGCFHILHSRCMETHLESYPPHTAPAGYMCPSCSTTIWPPKRVIDVNSGMYSKLKQIISQSKLANKLIGSDLIASSAQPGFENPVFSSPPLVVTNTSSSIAAPEIVSAISAPLGFSADGTVGQELSVGEVAQIHELGTPETSSMSGLDTSTSGSVSAAHFSNAGPPKLLQNGTMSRKIAMRGENLTPLEYEDDEDGSQRKYSRRGPLHYQLMRSLLPLWSPTLPTLPVTMPSSYTDKHDSPAAEDIIEGRSRRKQRNVASLDFKRLLLWVAIMSCMATVLLLYYRLAQGVGMTSNSIQVEDK